MRRSSRLNWATKRALPWRWKSSVVIIDDEIEIDSCVALPNATKWKFALLSSQATEVCQETPFDIVEQFGGKWSAVVVDERQIEVVAPS